MKAGWIGQMSGDTFNGTLAVGIAEGKNLKETIKFANAAGALSATKLGAQPSAPMKNDINNFMKSR